jgi:PAS domain S-box-containing protein
LKEKRKGGEYRSFEFAVNFARKAAADIAQLPDSHLQDYHLSMPRSTEEALARSEERYRSLVAATAQIVWVTTAAGEIVEDLPTWRAFTGQTFEQMKGYGWIEAVHPDDRDRVRREWNDSLRNGEPTENEFRVRHADRSWRHVSARTVPVKNPDGSVREWIGTCTDITDRRTSEEALQRAKEQAEAANRAKDQFLAVLSHELRTPLTPVLATVSALEMQNDLPRVVKADLEVIRRNVELETRLIDDLLDITRISKGKLQLYLEPIDLRDLINRVVEICNEDIVAKELLLLVDLPARGCYVNADSARVQQVLWNLIKNAVKFTPQGGKITVHAVCAEGWVELMVTDTGVGVDPQEMPRLFHAFQQGGPEEHRFGGLGLGLAISKALTELHGGQLTAHSAGKGHGTRFSVRLPAAARAPLPKPAAPAQPRESRPWRILLVEDHADTARIMLRLLRGDNYTVEWAGSVQSALRVASAQGFDLVVSDLGLPDGSGLELMRQLREQYGLKGIALSGYGMEEDVRLSRAAGFVEHLTKPINFQALRDKIESVMSS